MRGNPRPIPAVGHPLPNNPLVGTSPQGPGVEGVSNDGDGVFGNGKNGVHGRAGSNGVGVWGENISGGYGVKGSTNSPFVAGEGGTAGVWGDNTGTGTGVKGTSAGGDAVLGYSKASNHAGVAAVNDSGGFGVWARGTPAGHFEGGAGAVGVEAQGGSQSAGVLGIGGAANGPGVTGIGAGGTNLSPNAAVGVFGQGGGAGVGPLPAGVLGVGGPGSSIDNAPGVIGLGGPGPIPDFVQLEIVAAGVCGIGGPTGFGANGPGIVGVSGTGFPSLTPDTENVGIWAQGPKAVAAWGTQDGQYALQAYAFRGGSGLAAEFTGQVDISADLKVGGKVTIFGDLEVGGGLSVHSPIKSAVVPFPDGTHHRLYCLESPECWFEDFGSGQLIDGQAQVQLDPDFAAVVVADDYHVFLTEYEDNNGLYVTRRESTGFDVRAKMSAEAGGTFSYRVVAKRKDAAARRFEQVAPTAEMLRRTSDRRSTA
jgi:hypothetical protein